MQINTVGTRACTIIRMDRDGQGHVAEHRFGPRATPLGSDKFSFSLSIDVRRMMGTHEPNPAGRQTRKPFQGD